MTYPDLTPPPSPPPPAGESRYEVTGHPGWTGAALLAGGLAGALVIVWRFAMLLTAAPSTRPARDDGSVSGMAGGVGAMSFFLIAYGVTMLRRPVRARLSDTEIVIEGHLSRRTIPWSKVAQLRRDKQGTLFGVEKTDVLVLADENGKELGRLAGNFRNFHGLVAEVERRSEAARGAPTYNRDAELARRKARQLRQRRWLLAGCTFLLAMGLAATGWGFYEWRTQRRLAAEGVEAQATLDRHYLKSVTGWIEFTLTDPATGKTVKRSAMMDRNAWEKLRGQKQVTVRYLPSDPETNVVVGEDKWAGSPLLMVVLGLGLSALFGLALLFTAIGYDVDIKDGKVRFRRYDEVDDALEPAKPPPPKLFAMGPAGYVPPPYSPPYGGYAPYPPGYSAPPVYGPPAPYGAPPYAPPPQYPMPPQAPTPQAPQTPPPLPPGSSQQG